jgi:hypothetical protein
MQQTVVCSLHVLFSIAFKPLSCFTARGRALSPSTDQAGAAEAANAAITGEMPSIAGTVIFSWLEKVM